MQLYLAAQLGEKTPAPWERYLEAYKEASGQKEEPEFKTPAQTQRIFGSLLKQLGTPARDCVPRGNPTERSAGTKLLNRPNQPVQFKGKKQTSSTKTGIKTGSANKPSEPSLSEIEMLLNTVRETLKKNGFSAEEFSEKLLS